jgi:hypothetical protein
MEYGYVLDCTKTGTISGTPTVASDALTYTVTAVLMLYNMIGVDLRGQDAATVVIAVGAISAVVDNDLLDIFLTA